MTLPIEPRRSRRLLSILGVLLLPAVIGGILVAALQNPTQRLDAMTAAVVNLDEPVTIDGQYTPLGRQLAAGLVEGADELDSNLTWVISNEDDAREGLADGTYQAIVTIPADFSAAATSAGTALTGGDADDAERAEITVTTPPDGRVADDLITQQIASAAASALGTAVSEATVDNVLVGFATIGDQIGAAADGAARLADGADEAAAGAGEIPDGAAQLAEGAASLRDGGGQLAGGLDTIAGKAREASGGAGALGDGLSGGAATLEQDGLVPEELFAAARGAADATSGVASGVGELATGVDGLVALCQTRTPGVDPTGDQVCAGLGGLQQGLPDLRAGADLAAQAAAGTSDGLTRFDQAAPGRIAGQMRTAADAAHQLGAGLGQLADGVDQSATGARELSGGAGRLADGAAELGDGASALADGLDGLATGADELASGLDTAATSLPSFSDEESTSLASVIADPVAADAGPATLFGPTAIPLLAAVVLWFGALATFLTRRAMPGSVLTSRRSAAGLAVRAFWPGAVLGAGQGLLVALVVQLVAGYDAAAWWGFAGVAALAGIAFAAVNQTLVAALGGAGRWVSALVGVLALATGVISTVPGWLAGLGAAMPTAPALSGLIAPSGAAVAGLVVWTVLSLGVTTVAVARRRTTSVRAVLAAA
ncbi:YhgE/Pip domain-containing protein [Microbacterium neungamense]|uniref:YhgE/Pip domain-containing protein n=1 Tax=Microbacterium neungamense TaxID=2810535 RepID=UPI00217E87D6|nr:YhgE/Pip family protein [Microbacterium neungamense]UWF77837.1 YhgE/Pip family protein [Microbacterium neungamense]